MACGAAQLTVDLVLPADSVDFALVRELALLAPTGAGNPVPTLAITGLTVSRVRAANGGHTQLVLRRSRDVVDAVAFRRPDLAAMLHEGDRIDVAARAASRVFGGFELMQLEIVDVAAEGSQPALALPRPAASGGERTPRAWAGRRAIRWAGRRDEAAAGRLIFELMSTYLERLALRTRRVGSVLCLGVDPQPETLPAGFRPNLEGVERFCQVLIDAALPYAAAVKPNLAFFEAFGSAGIAALERLRGRVPG